MGQLPSGPFLHCTIKLAFTFSCWFRSVSISCLFMFTSPLSCHIALHTCACNHKPNPTCTSHRVNSLFTCTANIENAQLAPNKKTNAANNDGISNKEKSSGSTARISSRVEQWCRWTVCSCVLDWYQQSIISCQAYLQHQFQWKHNQLKAKAYALLCHKKSMPPEPPTKGSFLQHSKLVPTVYFMKQAVYSLNYWAPCTPLRIHMCTIQSC